MNIIEQVQQRLLRYPSLSYRLGGDNRITVSAPAPSGFSLSLEIAQNGYVVYFDGWHERFETEEEALNCFAFGLSVKCRLKVYRRGNFEHRWTLESLTETGWAEDSTTSLLFFPFWTKEECVYRQNSVIFVEQSSQSNPE